MFRKQFGMIPNRIWARCVWQAWKKYGSGVVVTRPLLTAASGAQPPSIQQAREGLKKIVGSPEDFSAQRDSSVMQLTLASNQSELSPRKMIDSYREAYIPLGTDKKLREKYVNFYSGVRFGRILEDLDTMAVLISYTHNQDPSSTESQMSALSIVTAAVDRIDMKSHLITADRDICLRGYVTYVGKTSMEVTMAVEQNNEAGDCQRILDAKFLMVARDPRNKGKAFVHPLLVEGAREEKLFKEGEVNKLHREQEARESLLRSPPSESERLVIHDLFLTTLDQKAATFKRPVKPEGSIWMDQSILKNIYISFPEQRNLYNKVFGGFLMRTAFELGWANACVYSKSRPFIQAVDDITFRKPVEIGSLLYLSSQVVYTSGPDLQLRVHAEVVDPKSGTHETTNVFHFTFNTKADVPPVMPMSYAEYMMFLDGKRHYEEAKTLEIQ